MSKLAPKIGRRKVLGSLGIVGAGATMLSFQNCGPGFQVLGAKGSNGSFGDPNGSGAVPTPTPGSGNSQSACTPPVGLTGTVFDAPAKPPTASAGVTTVNGMPVAPVSPGGEHSPNAKFYKTHYYDHVSQSEKDQHLITVDVGIVDVHTTPGADFSKLTVHTDIAVFETASGTLLFWKRLGGSDTSPSAMFVVPAALVSAGAKLTVVTNCLAHGYFSQALDLASTPLAYKDAVGTWVGGTAFGSSTLLRPYVSISATGMQNAAENIGTIHAPHFHTVTNSQIKMTLGQNTPAAKHGRFAIDHYVGGGFLYDQNSNLIASASEQSYKQSSDHSIVFDKLDLKGRKITGLRAVIFDTYNGFLMGFFTDPTVLSPFVPGNGDT